MGYMHIENLNKNDTILLFKQCWATEKVHGTSAHIEWDVEKQRIVYFEGGASRDAFVSLFDQEFENRFMELVDRNGRDIGVTVYGEAYGGKLQGMRETYGPKLRFIVFEVRVGIEWLSYPDVREVANALKIDVVPGKIVDCTEEDLTEYRNSPSEVAVLCGCGDNTDRYGNHPPLREGLVLRPLVECRTTLGKRIIAKYKNPDFSERQSKKDSDYRLRVSVQETETADRLAREWITDERLLHVLDALQIKEPRIEDTERIIQPMIQDILREGTDEVRDSEQFRRIAGREIVRLFKRHIGIL